MKCFYSEIDCKDCNKRRDCEIQKVLSKISAKFIQDSVKLKVYTEKLLEILEDLKKLKKEYENYLEAEKEMKLLSIQQIEKMLKNLKEV